MAEEVGSTSRKLLSQLLDARVGAKEIEFERGINELSKAVEEIQLLTNEKNIYLDRIASSSLKLTDIHTSLQEIIKNPEEKELKHEDQLTQQLSILKEQLYDVSTNVANEHILFKRFTQSKLLNEQMKKDTEFLKDQEKKLNILLEMMDQKSAKSIQLSNELDSLKLERDRLISKRKAISLESKESLNTIKQEHRVLHQSEPANVKSDYDQEASKDKILSYVIKSIIYHSKIDWSKDKKLTEYCLNFKRGNETQTYVIDSSDSDSDDSDSDIDVSSINHFQELSNRAKETSKTSKTSTTSTTSKTKSNQSNVDENYDEEDEDEDEDYDEDDNDNSENNQYQYQDKNENEDEDEDEIEGVDLNSDSGSGEDDDEDFDEEDYRKYKRNKSEFDEDEEDEDED